MYVSEWFLFSLVKLAMKRPLNPSELSAEKNRSQNSYDAFRREETMKTMQAADRAEICFTGMDVLDLGSGTGVISESLVRLAGAKSVVGVDISEKNISCASEKYTSEKVRFVLGDVNVIPLDSLSIDIINCFDVFEHIVNIPAMLSECYRVLRHGGKMLIGTWGWFHPYAPHFWHVMPVPWAHVFFSEKTFMRVCRKVYLSEWYKPNPFELINGKKDPNRYAYEEISTSYVNKLLIRDFECHFKKSSFKYKLLPISFGKLGFTAPLLKVPILREFLTGYLWVFLLKSNRVKGRF